MSNNILFKSIINKQSYEKITKWSKQQNGINSVVEFLASNFKIDITNDLDIVKGFTRDSSNLAGKAEALCRPVNEIECSLILICCQKAKIPMTIAAGRTNLNGSATPEGGLVISMDQMKKPVPKVIQQSKTVITPVGIYLEEMRQEVLKQSNKKLYYPVDPTSRKEAMVGGTLSCNASGFIPGSEGSTRFWTEGLDFLLPQGYKISCKRGEYISNNGEFIIDIPEGNITLPISTYPRPNIKNASGPFSDNEGKVDLVDFIVGSEGIYGLITSAIFRLKDMPDEFLDLYFTLPSEKYAIRFYQYISNYFDKDLSQITALEYFGYNCQQYMDHRNKLFNNVNEVGIYMQIPLFMQTIEDVAGEWFHVLKKSNCGINIENIILLNEPHHWQTFFEARHSIPSNALAKTRKLNTWSILTDTIVPPNNFQEFLNKTHNLITKASIEYLLFGHLGDCHLHFHLIPTKNQQSLALEVYDKIVNISASLGGIYSAEHGTGKRKRMDFRQCFGNEAVDQVRLTKSIIDPDFLLNRGNVILC